jgi:hypothetical protein
VPGIEPDPTRLIHIRLSAAPDGGQLIQQLRQMENDGKVRRILRKGAAAGVSVMLP